MKIIAFKSTRKHVALVGLLLFPLALFAENGPNERLLPNSFPVYTFSKGVINHPGPDTTEKKLPTVNAYHGAPGCYVACYSHKKQGSVYSVGDNIYVMGQIRVPGSYASRVCLPAGYEHKDISGQTNFKQLCEKYFPEQCNGLVCWAGGDTGGWFGIQ